MPLRQWYSSAKQPPGQRTFGTFSAFSAATTSLRMPRVLGIAESGPTQMPFVDAVAEMLGELAEDVAVDLRAGFGSVHRQSKLVGGHERSGENRSQKNQTNQESAHGKGDVLCWS